MRLQGRTFDPTNEQSEALEHFAAGRSLKINAYAGTGKTSTLELLSKHTSRHGQYIAFNRAIVQEAKGRFAKNVNCATSHGLARRAVASQFAGSTSKLFQKMNANHLAQLLELTRWQLGEHHVLQPRSQGFLILDTIRRFAHSADDEFGPQHVPIHGSLLAAPQYIVDQSREFAVQQARRIWGRMTDPADDIPLGHDGYLKLWSLSRPDLATDFILLDEAQDTNPAVLEVLKRQKAQIIYVGDRYQQIYEWRGAVNAMDSMSTDSETFLTTSFRFGDAIALLASRILTALQEDRPLQGNATVSSRIGASSAPRAILARTNASTISAVIDAIDAGRMPHLVGGVEELMAMLGGVRDLKQGQPSTIPDFFGFTTWEEVVEFAESPDGQHLATFVNLVEARGERQLMWALYQTVDEEKCDLVVSTAHKAKGREWKSVRLVDDFLNPSASKREKEPEERRRQALAELRLLYVALTRAKEELDVPPPLLEKLAFKP